MFDIGGLELLVIAVVALVVIGPKDLPVAIRTVRQWMTRARDLAREFQGGLDEIARDAKLEEVKREIDEATRPDGLVGDLRTEIENSIDPGGRVADSLKLDRDWFSPDAGDAGRAAVRDETAAAPALAPPDSAAGAPAPVPEPAPARRDG
jgi:sec-independent protein translocase protein TatB